MTKVKRFDFVNTNDLRPLNNRLGVKMKAESRVANLITRADWVGVARRSETTVAVAAAAASLLKNIFILHDVLINFSTSNCEVRNAAIHFFHFVGTPSCFFNSLVHCKTSACLIHYCI